MKERTITSVVIVLVGILLVIFSGYIVYPAVIALIGVTAVYEILKVMKSHKTLVLSLPAYILAAAFPIFAYFVSDVSFTRFLLILAATVFVYMMWLMGVSIFSKGSIPFPRISEVFVSVAYVTVSVSSLSLIRYIDRESGVFSVVLVFLISWICDVFAFVVGSICGKHKLIPEVSPKKTVEGSIGGIAFSILFCLLYGFGLDLIVDGMTVNYVVLGGMGAILSVVSQLGDLVASLIKREYGVKDYGSIFPGHGGIMDRFDSVLAVSTVVLIVSVVFPPFTVA